MSVPEVSRSRRAQGNRDRAAPSLHGAARSVSPVASRRAAGLDENVRGDVGFKIDARRAGARRAPAGVQAAVPACHISRESERHGVGSRSRLEQDACACRLHAAAAARGARVAALHSGAGERNLAHAIAHQIIAVAAHAAGRALAVAAVAARHIAGEREGDIRERRGHADLHASAAVAGLPSATGQPAAAAARVAGERDSHMVRVVGHKIKTPRRPAPPPVLFPALPLPSENIRSG